MDEIRTWDYFEYTGKVLSTCPWFSIHNVRPVTATGYTKKNPPVGSKNSPGSKLQRIFFLHTSWSGHFRRHSNLLLAKAGKCGDLKRLTPSVTHWEVLRVKVCMYRGRFTSNAAYLPLKVLTCSDVGHLTINAICQTLTLTTSCVKTLQWVNRNLSVAWNETRGKSREKFWETLFHNHEKIYIYIQGVPGRMCQTSGGCSLC